MVVAKGTGRKDRSIRRSHLLTGFTSIAFAAALLGASSSIASTSALVLEQAPKSNENHINTFLRKRHGDDEHEEEQQQLNGMPMDHMSPAPDKQQSTSTIELEHEQLHHQSKVMTNEEAHSHAHGSHSHNEMESMHIYIPDPHFESKESFIPVPKLPKGAGGHSHGGHAEPKLDLNESVIVRGKGPDPLSYIEWDFAYGIGKSEDLLRFSQAYYQKEENVMGVGGDRWRTLLDERDRSMRLSIASDIRKRVEGNPEDPGRHRTLLILHVIGCIFSCFVLLPIGECQSNKSAWSKSLLTLPKFFPNSSRSTCCRLQFGSFGFTDILGLPLWILVHVSSIQSHDTPSIPFKLSWRPRICHLLDFSHYPRK